MYNEELRDKDQLNLVDHLVTQIGMFFNYAITKLRRQ